MGARSYAPARRRDFHPPLLRFRSLSTEIGYQRAVCSLDTWTIEIRPIQQGINDFSVAGIEPHHRLGFATGSAQNVILHVTSEPGASSTSTGEIVVGGHRGGICVYDSDVAPESR